jgi:hypothetical protein
VPEELNLVPGRPRPVELDLAARVDDDRTAVLQGRAGGARRRPQHTATAQEVAEAGDAHDEGMSQPEQRPLDPEAVEVGEDERDAVR